ncbi:hypothetical protein ACP70R_015241 [Stipagrostis hirtigluma subsp. patula]
MALRYLARRVGVPALRRASGPRVSPSAGSRPLTSSSSQGGHTSGPSVPGARKAVNFKDANELDQEIEALRAEFEKNRNALEKAFRKEKNGRRFLMACGLAGFGIPALLAKTGNL